MHSSIVGEILTDVWNVLFYNELPWDNFTFTLWDVFKFQLLFMVVVCLFSIMIRVLLRLNSVDD